MKKTDEAGPQRVDGLIGTVAAGPFGAGSKSESEAVWLQTADRRLVLRRKNGPAFGDRTLDRYVGKRVKCSGFIVGYAMLAEKIQIVS